MSVRMDFHFLQMLQDSIHSFIGLFIHSLVCCVSDGQLESDPAAIGRSRETPWTFRHTHVIIRLLMSYWNILDVNKCCSQLL